VKKKCTENETEKIRKLICGKFKCPNYGEFSHRKNSMKCPHSGTKKRRVLHISPKILSPSHHSL
jgi:hypothetical protein